MGLGVLSKERIVTLYDFYDRPGTGLKLKVQMLKTEVIEALLYRCMWWSLLKGYYEELRQAHHPILRRCIDRFVRTEPSRPRHLLPRNPYKNARRNRRDHGEEAADYPRRLRSLRRDGC